MALSKVYSFSLNGLDAIPVEVEVDIRAGLPAFNIVGLGDKAIEESKERIKSAITNSGFQFPTKKVVVNLAPAHIKKEGSWFDLPIALGILLASGQLPKECLYNSFIVGELALNGNLRFCPGILIVTDSAKKLKAKQLILPKDNYLEAKLVKNIDIVASENLFDLSRILKNEISPKIYEPDRKTKQKTEEALSFSDIKGQLQAKNGLIIALSGGHNLLFYGPPGTGKSLLAKASITLMPELETEEALEVTKIYSMIGKLNQDNPLLTTPPFRSPHHSSSHISLIGGGANPIPGEITLAHRGILFLDELPEFSRQSLEGLRQPLEDHKISIARAKAHLEYPANFILIGTMNPCPCGFYGDEKKNCTCSMGQIQQYRKKISGPILDRFDIFVKLPRLSQKELLGQDKSINIESTCAKIKLARKVQYRRNNCLNSQISIKKIEETIDISSQALDYLLSVVEKFDISPRSFHKIMRISRTIADLENQKTIEISQIGQALQFRSTNEIIA